MFGCISGVLVQPIAFHAARKLPMSSGKRIAFNTVLTNIGNSWNSATHMFTAPTKGLYYFTLRIMLPYTNTSHFAWASIKHGHVSLSTIYLNRSSKLEAHMSASGSAVVMLNAGQQVHAERLSGNLFSNDALLINFLGFLIHKVN